MDNRLKIGDIVYCRGNYEVTQNRIGFIEEVVDQPRPHERLGRKGLYSIYGLEKPNPTGYKSQADWYFGDHAGKDLEPTGNTMTVADIQEYKRQHEDNNLLQRDMDKVIQEMAGLVVN